MAMLQTWFMSFVLLVQSLFVPLFNTPATGPMDYGGEPYVAPVISEWLPLVEGGETDYSIVMPDNPPQSVRTGARWLSEFIAEMTGVTITPVTVSDWGGGKYIALGNTGLDAGALAADLAKLENEGFVKRVVGENIYICGVGRGSMYGCASFLEEELGCYWLTPTRKVIPKRQDVSIDKNLHSIENTALEYREVQWGVINRNAEFLAFNRVNSSNSCHIGEEFGGSVNYMPGVGFCHTMYNLIPRSDIDEFPELFAWRDDQQARVVGQRCLSNPEVLRRVTDAVVSAISAYPGDDVPLVSVTHDDNEDYCQCDGCEELDRKYGGPTGTNLWFVNQIAETVETTFPGRELYIDTFAYSYTLNVPDPDAEVVVKPRHNVIVRLCSIDCCFSHPFSECGHRDEASNFTKFTEKPSEFARQTKEWAALCKETGAKLYVWDYTTNFKHYPTLFPNFHVLSDNIRFLIDNNVHGIFEQGNVEGSGINGEFAELRAYLLTKLLWAPETDVERMMDIFLEGYYGPAAPHIKDFLNLITRVAEDTIHLSIFGRVEANLFLKPSQLTRADKLFDDAEKAAAGDEYYLTNVKRSRISLRCYKANFMVREFSWLNPFRRISENKKLFNDIIMSGIDSISAPIVEPYSTYVWLHRPYDWGDMSAWVEFYDEEKLIPMDLAEYRATHEWSY